MLCSICREQVVAMVGFLELMLKESENILGSITAEIA